MKDIIDSNENNYNNQNNLNYINNQNFIYSNSPYYQNNGINMQQQYDEIKLLNSSNKDI